MLARSFFLGILFLNFFTFWPQAQIPIGNRYYVALTGSNQNPGSLDAPFQTIQKCADVMVAGDSCFIRAGTYHETVTPAHSGTANAPITFAPYDTEVVTIDGSDPVTGWAAYESNIYRARVTLNPDLAANQVFVDADMQPQARWPNTGPDPLHPTWAVAKVGTTYQTIVDPLLPALNWQGATIHLWAGTNAFTHQIATIIASAAGKIDLSPLPQQACPILCPQPDSFYYILGGLQTLDAPGEWYYDGLNHWLYLWAPDSANPASLQVSAKQRGLGVDLRGRSYIQLLNLHFFSNTVMMDADSQGNLLQGLEARYLSHFDTLPFAAPDTLLADGDSPIGQLVASHELDSGLILAGSGNVLRDSQLSESAGNGVLVLGHDNTVTNNVIHDVGYLGSYATAINLAGYNQTVTYNTIYNTGRDGITVDWHIAGTTFINNHIEHNDISNFALLNADAGGIYLCCRLDGSGTVVAYNLIHDVGLVKKPSGDYLTGLYSDNGSSQILFHHNVVWNTENSVGANGETNNRWYNNTFLSGQVRDAGKFYNTLLGPGVEAPPNNACGLPEGAAPTFEDAHRANYRLTPNSAGVDAGCPFPGLTNDYVGKAPDVGAYETGQPLWAAGSSWATKSITGLLQAERFTAQRGVTAENDVLTNLDKGDWVAYANVDFGEGVSAVEVALQQPQPGGVLTLRMDGTRGPLLATVPVTDGDGSGVVTIPASSAIQGVHTLFLLISQGENVGQVDWLGFKPAIASALNQLDANRATTQQGTENIAGYVGSFDDGDWLEFDSVDFGTGSQRFTANVAVAPQFAGRFIEIHLDSVTGPRIGTLQVAATQGWEDFVTQSTSVTKVAGVHNVYLVARGGAGVANLAWFKFEP